MTFKALKKGDKVAVIATSGRLKPEKLEKGAAALTELGFTPVLYPQCGFQDGYFAGTDRQRADALMEAYRDKETAAIWCARGGYGAARLLDLLDYDVIKNNPKPLIGYSDITALHLAFYKRLRRIGIHGRMLGDMGGWPSAEGDAQQRDFVMGNNVDYLKLPEANPRTLVKGTAEGVLLGGNLTTMVNLIGTKDAPDFNEAILFVEEIEEELYHFDRMLVQLRRAGVSGLRGVVLGGLTKMKDGGEDNPFGKNGAEIILDHFGKLGVPVVADFPSGHITHSATLPIGAKVRLTASERVSLEPVEPVFG